MRVIHFAETLKGGPATHLNQLLRFQVKAYDSVSVLCPERHANLIDCPATEVLTFPDTERNLGGFIALNRAWRTRLRENPYDILHLHSSFAGAVGRLGLTKTKAPIVYCARGWAFGMKCSAAKKRIYGLAERLLSYRTDAIINISRNEDALSKWAGIPQHKCRTVYNGIDDAPWSPLPEGHKPRRLLFVGRYDWAKGVDLIIEAMKTLSVQGFTLDTIGGLVTDKPRATDFPGYIVDRGWREPSEIQEAMAAADIIVVPSRWEGFGFVAAEASRAGRPVVATSVGGLKEIVIDGETGVLCEPDSAKAIADGVFRVSRMDVRGLGINGRKRFETLFTSERMFREIDAIYQDLSKSRTGKTHDRLNSRGPSLNEIENAGSTQ